MYHVSCICLVLQNQKRCRLDHRPIGGWISHKRWHGSHSDYQMEIAGEWNPTSAEEVTEPGVATSSIAIGKGMEVCDVQIHSDCFDDRMCCIFRICFDFADPHRLQIGPPTISFLITFRKSISPSKNSVLFRSQYHGLDGFHDIPIEWFIIRSHFPCFCDGLQEAICSRLIIMLGKIIAPN